MRLSWEDSLGTSARGRVGGGVTDLQPPLSGPHVLGRRRSHRDGSNQLGVFPLQPLREVPQEPGETCRASVCVLRGVCLRVRGVPKASEGEQPGGPGDPL